MAGGGGEEAALVLHPCGWGTDGLCRGLAALGRGGHGGDRVDRCGAGNAWLASSRGRGSGAGGLAAVAGRGGAWGGGADEGQRRGGAALSSGGCAGQFEPGRGAG